jgi:hypothetical protein
VNERSYRDNTYMANNPHARDNLIPFKKGDVRINRAGRPRSFDALRKLAVKIAQEPVDENKEDSITRIENLLRAYSNPRHPKSEKFLEYAYGKVPNPVELTGKDGEKLVVEVKYTNSPVVTSAVSSEPTDNP